MYMMIQLHHLLYGQKTPELMFDLPSKSLDALFDACLLENETPEPNGIKEVLVTSEQEREKGQAQVEEVSFAVNCQSRSSAEVEEVSRDPKDSKIFTVPPSVIKKTHKELIKLLESSFNVEVSVMCLMFLFKCLVEHLMEELETLSQIKITHQILGGWLFSDENEASSYIAHEAYKSLLNKHLMKGASCELEIPEVQEDSDQHSRVSESKRRSKSAASRNVSTLSCSTVISKLSSSEFEDLICECDGFPALSDLSDECSAIFTGYQNYRRYGYIKRPSTYLVKCVESSLEESPDLLSSIPAVQVTEVSENLMENNQDLEISACPYGTEDAIIPKQMKKWQLHYCIFSFLRRVFCHGCIPSHHVEPL
ncbi:hypothetical protein SRHO_G00093550 [Serrasalmus rhombeus]